MNAMQKALIPLGALILSCFIMSCNIADNGGSTLPGVDRRALSADLLARKAICYSGFRADQSPNTKVYPSDTQILEDLNLLVQGGFGFIRIYNAAPLGERVVKLIKDNNLNLKVQLGIWIDWNSAQDAAKIATAKAANSIEIEAGIALAKAYPDVVATISVGNETVVDWSGLAVPPAQLVTYIKQVRDAVTQPVTTDDNWEPFSLYDESGKKYDTLQVAKAVDFLSIHTYAYFDACYALWDYQQTGVTAGTARANAMMDAALAYTKKNITAVRNAMNNNGLSGIPIVIGEVGWKDIPGPVNGKSDPKYYGNPVNQKMFFDRLYAWVYGATKDATSPGACFYFEAFNEPWKSGDDGWGLFDVNRVPKYVAYDLYPSLKPANAPVLTEANALYWIPTPETTPQPVTSDIAYIYEESTHDTTNYFDKWSWNSWESNATAAISDSDSGASEGSKAAKIVPSPLSWGWGMTIVMDAPLDLSAYASGKFHFSIKTTYAGSLEIGFLTGDPGKNTASDVYLKVNPASNTYGLKNDGAWHDVTIPVADISAKATPAYNMPATAKLNLGAVLSPFVIADRFGNTGTTGSPKTPIYVDNIYWSKN